MDPLMLLISLRFSKSMHLWLELNSDPNFYIINNSELAGSYQNYLTSSDLNFENSQIDSI